MNSDDKNLRRAVGLALKHVLDPDGAKNRDDRDLRDSLIALGFLKAVTVSCEDGDYWEPRLTTLGQSCVDFK